MKRRLAGLKKASTKKPPPEREAWLADLNTKALIDSLPEGLAAAWREHLEALDAQA